METVTFYKFRCLVSQNKSYIVIFPDKHEIQFLEGTF